MSDVPHERQVRWPASRGLSRIAPGTSYDENRQSDEFFSPCHVRVTLKFRWFIWVCGTRNGWIHLSFGWWSLLWTDFDHDIGYVLRGFLGVPPRCKKWQMSCHILWLPPWCSICRNCIGLIQEVHIWMRSGGSFNCRLLFSNRVHCWWPMIGVEPCFAESWNTPDLYF